jgi:hypothetical protein
MRTNSLTTLLALTTIAALLQTAEPLKRAGAVALPSSQFLNQPGPTFVVPESQLSHPLTVITYGDTRFTDPANTTATNPKVRQWLVQRIAEERPDAVLLNGDLPLAGDVKNDYAVFKTETRSWRNAHLRIFPALGNHEFHGDPQQCLRNWWDTFPDLRNLRWYSAQLGPRVYIVVLDSTSSLLEGSQQFGWLAQQLKSIPSSTDFVLITLHHPPVADVQQHIQVSHNPRPNEIALRDFLSKIAERSHARFIVSAGHIHNYERQIRSGVVYLVSGGGGAKPYVVERTPEDLYRSNAFPNYHYVKLTLEQDRMHGTMFRLSDAEAAVPVFVESDSFDVKVKPAFAQIP